MTARRGGIFFHSKSRPIVKIEPILPDISSDHANNTLDPTETTASGKKKIILNHTKRNLPKTIYSGPRKIFSTNYKANRTQINPRAFFGGNADEYDLDRTERKPSNTLRSTTISRIQIEQKQVHTVVANFRQPTSCAEVDETQSYIDDMDYLLAGFQPEKLLAARCLSAIKFAELCLKPSFRRHLRTEGALNRIFDLLEDAPDVPSLSLCTAFILYILSSDTLTSAMNSNIISLMLNLVQKSSTIPSDDQEYTKMKERILIINKRSLPDLIFYEQRFHTCDIILETFVHLSRQHLSESLRNELQTLGGYDLMINQVHGIVQDLSNNDFECYSLSDLLIRYRKVSRYINMLEEFANENTDQTPSSSTGQIDVNRMYIAQYHQYSLFHSLSKLLDLSLIWMQEHLSKETNNQNACDAFRDGCKTIMSILVILTNDCEVNCDRLTSDDRFLSNLFRLLVIIEKSSFTNEDKFDTLALTLNLLINLVQNTKHIYQHLMEQNMPDGSSLKIYAYLAKLFCEQESSAARAESHEENDWMMENVDDDFEEQPEKQSFNSALQKAANHMENTFVAAFAGVVLAVVLSRDREAYTSRIRELMPQKKFDTMAFILKKFFVFMHMSHAFTPSGVKILDELTSLVLSLCG